MKGLYDALRKVTNAPDGVDAAAFLEEIGLGLLDVLLVDYLVDQFPAVHATLRALGVVVEEFAEATPERPGVLAQPHSLG